MKESDNARWGAVAALVGMALQFLLVLFVAYLIGHDRAAGGFSSWQGLVVIPVAFVGFPLSGVAGLIVVWIWARTGRRGYAPLGLLVTSLIMLSMIGPADAAQALSPWFESF